MCNQCTGDNTLQNLSLIHISEPTRPLYISFSSSSGEAVEVLNRCLGATMDWMRANKLKLNPDKTDTVSGWFF